MSRKRKSRRVKVDTRLRDPGPDPSGNFGVNPFTARGHVIEVAPQELRVSRDSAFPKRIATQRMIDRYHRAGHIDDKQWAAGCRLWSLFHGAGWNPRVISSYIAKVDNETTHSAQLSHRIEFAAAYLKALAEVPYRSKGVVVHVVVVDAAASDWARVRGFRGRDSERHGMDRLRSGLSALAAHFGY